MFYIKLPANILEIIIIYLKIYLVDGGMYRSRLIKPSTYSGRKEFLKRVYEEFEERSKLKQKMRDDKRLKDEMSQFIPELLIWDIYLSI